MSLSKRALVYILDWHTDNEEDDDAIVGNWQSTLAATTDCTAVLMSSRGAKAIATS